MKNNIRLFLDKKLNANYSLDSFIQDSAIGKTSLFEIMRGKQMPKLNTAIKIASALDTSIDEVFPELKEVLKID